MTAPTQAPDVEVTMEIAAPPETVFRYFTDPARFARWIGNGSTIDPTPGGALHVVYQGGAAAGKVVELDPPSRVVFTWGAEGNEGMPPGSTTVTITLTPTASGTSVRLVHAGIVNPEFRQGATYGWKNFLSGLASNAVEEATART